MPLQINQRSSTLANLNNLSSISNPKSLVQNMIMNNPKARSLVQLFQSSGMTPKQFFYQYAQQNGVDPEQFLNSLQQ